MGGELRAQRTMQRRLQPLRDRGVLHAVLPLRWVFAALYFASALLAWTVGASALAVGGLMSAGVVLAITNVFANWFLARPHDAIGGSVLLDVCVLTVALALTGGPANPFSVLYIVYVALAATLLETFWMWLAVVASSGGFALLFAFHLPLPAAGHVHEGSFSLHLQGMWLAYVVAAVAIVRFVARLAAELRREREDRERTRHVLAVATLAAGAAHELGNPLGTIRIATDELRDTLERSNAPTDALEDVNLIAEEVARARSVLDRMSSGAVELDAEKRDTRPLALILESLIDELGSESTRVELQVSEPLPKVEWPPAVTDQALRQLIRNALQASKSKVELTARALNGEIEVTITDGGRGMDAQVLAKSTEPFFTTRPEEGMGLGLFIARSLIEHVGGRLQIESVVARGTTVRVTLPASENP